MLVSEAAKQLGMNTQTLRLGLQQGLFPFGKAIKTSENRYTYYINDNALEHYSKGYMYEKYSYYWDIASTNSDRAYYSTNN